MRECIMSVAWYMLSKCKSPVISDEKELAVLPTGKNKVKM